jgi:hypothetical protein
MLNFPMILYYFPVCPNIIAVYLLFYSLFIYFHFPWPRSRIPINPIQYRNTSVYEQPVSEFSLIRDAHINTCSSVYEPIFAYTSSFLSQTDRCSLSGSNGKLIFVSRVFALRAVLDERIKLVNRGVPVLSSSNAYSLNEQFQGTYPRAGLGFTVINSP